MVNALAGHGFPEGVSAVTMNLARVPMLVRGPPLALTAPAYRCRRSAGSGERRG
ncbi:hypothetical protein [Streptosporangium sp. NPDC051022]|uniref:hypothetical protein n=1 Tax=Streptosporangium sp. NPDC051022 TaxID=3155752 RepID=UPI00341C49F6